MARQSKDQGVVITDVRHGRSTDIETRQRRYAISMAIRTACFILMFFVPGALLKIICVAGAAIIPGVAVVLANARDNRTPPADLAEPAPEGTLMITPGQVIRGEAEEVHQDPR